MSVTPPALPPRAKLRSRLAQRLDADIAQFGLPHARRGALEVQRALLWLRHGRDAEARAELDRLHAYALAQPSAALGAWLHFAEGLMGYFGNFSAGAAERMRRAQVMARAAGLTDLLGLAEAWLAQMAFVCRDPAGLVTHARAALAASSEADHAVRFRTATALASAWSLCGDDTLAAAWYGHARQHAVAAGDDAGLAALLYNQTQMRALRIRDTVLRGAADEARAALISSDSIDRFDSAVGGSARADLTPLLRAQLLTLRGEFSEAAALLEAQLPAAISAGLARVGGSLMADLAWCWAQSGQPRRARALADQAAIEALADVGPGCDIDDRAALHSRLAQVYAHLGDAAAAEREAREADDAWLAYSQQREDWAATLTAAGLREAP
jgi:hypothetical protein